MSDPRRKLTDLIFNHLVCKHGCRWKTYSRCSMNMGNESCECVCHKIWAELDTLVEHFKEAGRTP